MGRIRPELVKGLSVLGLFCVLIVTTSILVPYPITISNYTSVSLEKVKLNPSLFEGLNISSTATVESTLDLFPITFVTTQEGVSLQIRHGLDDLPDFVKGDRLFVRGTYRNGSVEVREYYVLDYFSSLIRSIPGIIIFVILFFYFFKIDLKHLAFVPRRSKDA